MTTTNKQSDWPSEKNPLLVLHGDVRGIVNDLPDNSVQCVVTSPPYWGVRDYGTEGQIGAETDLQEYISTYLEIFRIVTALNESEGKRHRNLLNRHAVMHGTSTNYGTEINSLKALSYLYSVWTNIEAIQKRQNLDSMDNR